MCAVGWESPYSMSSVVAFPLPAKLILSYYVILEMFSSLSSVRSLTAVSPTAGKKRDLEEAQKQLNLPQHSLKTACPTRWGSKQAIINRILAAEGHCPGPFQVTKPSG